MSLYLPACLFILENQILMKESNDVERDQRKDLFMLYLKCIILLKILPRKNNLFRF